MKCLPIFLISLFLATTCFPQSGYQVIIRVIDNDSNMPVPGAFISLKEKGWQTKKADANGTVVFKEVVSRDINFTVIAEDYLRAEENRNVAEQEESNTFEVKLLKPNADRVILLGEVTDPNGNDVVGATVEFKLVNILKIATTDASGNYLFEIDLNQLAVHSDEGEIEIKKGECKAKEKILVNQKVISKSIKLDCQANPPGSSDEEPSTPTGGLGSVCFKNLLGKDQIESHHKIQFKLYKYTADIYKSEVTIIPSEEKCFYELKPGVYSYRGTYLSLDNINGSRISMSHEITGQVLVEKGKMKLVELKG